jgi:hypothetical protein
MDKRDEQLRADKSSPAHINGTARRTVLLLPSILSHLIARKMASFTWALAAVALPLVAALTPEYVGDFAGLPWC